MTTSDYSPITLISGTRKGIGQALVGHYAQLGHRVIGCSRGQPDWQLNGYQHFAIDIADEPAVKAMFAQIRTDHGHIDNLVNNAGIASMNHSLLTPMETVRRVLDTNVAGCFLLSREAAKLMRKAKRGRIVNLTTVAVPLRVEGEAIYAASKAAVNTLTEILAREFADFGVTVNAVGPVPIDTDLIRSVPNDKIEALVARQAIRRRGTIADVTNVVDFFLDEESDFVTGQVLYLGGV